MDLQEWLKKPTVRFGKMSELEWVLAELEIDYPSRQQDFGKVLMDAGWTRVMKADGRCWYAPGEVPINDRGIKIKVMVALREHMRAVVKCKVLDALKAMNLATGCKDTDLMMQAIGRIDRLGEIGRGPYVKDAEGKTDKYARELTWLHKGEKGKDAGII